MTDLSETPTEVLERAAGLLREIQQIRIPEIYAETRHDIGSTLYRIDAELSRRQKDD